MKDREFFSKCCDCEAEFDVTHEEIVPPEFCPFCGEKLTYDDKDLDEWFEEDESNPRGC